MGNPALTSINRLMSGSGGLKDPLLDFKWVVESQTVPDLDGFVGIPSNHIESVDVPFNNIQIESGQFTGSGFTYYPGFHDISSFSINVYEDQECTALKWTQAWKARVKNFSTGEYYLPRNYKGNLRVALLNSKNDIICRVKLIGVWPADTQSYSLNYTNNGRVVMSQTLSVDDQEITF